MSVLENPKLVKSIIVGVAGFSIDKLYFKSTSLKNSMILASSTASASFVSSILSPKLQIHKRLRPWTKPISLNF